MNTNEKYGQRSNERIIDGERAVPVVMVKTPFVVPSCGPGRHCAAHCEAPHPCCRCGAWFVPVDAS